MTNLSIIVLNWNKPELTIECIKSLFHLSSNQFDTKILIVDNGSSDDSVKIIRKYLRDNPQNTKNMSCEIIETGLNMGFAGGNNYGIRYALKKSADYVILLNNDTRVSSDFAKELMKPLLEGEDVGIVCPKIYFEKGFEYKKYKKNDLGKVIWSVGGVFDWGNIYGTNKGVDQVDRGQFEKSETVDFASGACFLISKEVIQECGLFDESYFMYLEGVDLSQRVRIANYKIIYAPKSIVWHKVSQSSAIGGDLNDYFISRNRLIFGFRYASMQTKFALFRESLRIMLSGRKWQRIGIMDYYTKNLGIGSWK